MPYEWVDPEELLTESEITVYHCYKNNTVMSYWFTVDAADCDDDSPGYDDDDGYSRQFDVRDLPAVEKRDEDHWEWCRDTIRSAIQAGVIIDKGVKDWFLSSF
jgi:hypothetical protein